jgi:hypothetical protein
MMKYPPPLKVFSELFFVLSVILVILYCSVDAVKSFFGHPVIVFSILCIAVLLWYRSRDS